MPLWNLFGLDAVTAQLNRIEVKINQLLAGQQAGKAMIMSEQEEIQNLIQQVAANRDASQAAVQAMTGMLQRIADQGQELQDAIAAGGTDVSPDIKAAADDLQASTAALQDAIPHVAHAIVQGTKAAT
jgi:hypothetical protein